MVEETVAYRSPNHHEKYIHHRYDHIQAHVSVEILQVRLILRVFEIVLRFVISHH